jgi:hypothetical protein
VGERRRGRSVSSPVCWDANWSYSIARFSRGRRRPALFADVRRLRLTCRDRSAVSAKIRSERTYKRDPVRLALALADSANEVRVRHLRMLLTSTASPAIQHHFEKIWSVDGLQVCRCQSRASGGGPLVRSRVLSRDASPRLPSDRGIRASRTERHPNALARSPVERFLQSGMVHIR